MRTFTYSALCFTALLILCLMFAPSRRVTGDRMATAAPIEVNVAEATTTKDFAELCRTAPLEAVAESLRAYKKLNPDGYNCTFVKQERIGSTLHPQETIACNFRQAPFAVLMRWQEGKRRADATLYVAGSNDDKLLIVPSGDLEKRLLKLKGTPYAKRALDSADAKGAARYPADRFGIFNVTTNVYTVWKVAHEQDALQVAYLGVQEIAELDGRRCHVLERTCVAPEEDGTTRVVIYFDEETHLQLGSVLHAGEELVGRYFYRNLQWNPQRTSTHFNAEQFQ